MDHGVKNIILNQENKTIIGIDEVGYGAVAGPLVLAGVILEKNNCGIADSKKLTSKQREVMYQWLIINSKCIEFIECTNFFINDIHFFCSKTCDN